MAFPNIASKINDRHHSCDALFDPFIHLFPEIDKHVVSLHPCIHYFRPGAPE